MFRRTLIALGAVLLSAACAQTRAVNADNPLDAATGLPDPEGSAPRELLNRLAGRWVLTGVIAGQSTVHDVEAEWVLQRNYVRIHEISREKNDDGQPMYEATIFIGWAKDRYVCFWLDNTEVASGDVACTAAEAPDLIPLQFRDREGALIFTNDFSYNRADDAWEWRMANIRNGEADPFGTVSLRRR